MNRPAGPTHSSAPSFAAPVLAAPVLAALTFFAAAPSPAQAGSANELWTYTLTKGGSQLYGAAVARDASDMLYVTGSDPLADTIVTAKFDPAGNLLWFREYDHAGTRERASWMDVDSQGNVLICGYHIATNGSRIGMVVLSYDPAGNLRWSDTRSTTRGYLYRCVVGPADQLVAVGTEWVTNSSGNTTDDVYVAQWDSLGNRQWDEYLGADAFSVDNGTGVVVRPNGEVVVSGGGIGVFLVASYDTTGAFLWKDQFAASTNAISLALTPTGDTVAVGGTYDKATGNLYLVRDYDSQGQLVWSKTYPGYTATRVAVNSAGTIFVTGNVIQSGSAYIDFLTYSLDPAGNVNWSQAFDQGRYNDEIPSQIFPGPQGEVYVIGQANIAGGSYLETAAVRYAADGTQEWTYVNSLSLRALGAVRSSDGTMTLVGESTFTVFHVEQHPVPLSFQIDPEVVVAGDTLDLSVQHGKPGKVMLWAVVGVNGTPTFLIMGFGLFDGAGQWSLSATVPPGLAGLSADFQAMGKGEIGKNEWSGVETVLFQ